MTIIKLTDFIIMGTWVGWLGPLSFSLMTWIHTKIGTCHIRSWLHLWAEKRRTSLNICIVCTIYFIQLKTLEVTSLSNCEHNFRVINKQEQKISPKQGKEVSDWNHDIYMQFILYMNVKTIERLLRDYRETIEKLLRDCWDTLERLLRDYWETNSRLWRD